jgi:YHS domain-containing protein
MMKILLSAGVFLAMYFAATAQKSEIFVKDSFAINGYDVVAYFSEAKPVKGSTEVSVTYKEVTWLFANKANADLFKANPEKYEPQYGGYCAYGCSEGHKAKTSPDAWTIVNGKLYLNYNVNVKELWNKDQEGNIKKANVNWLKIKADKF